MTLGRGYIGSPTGRRNKQQLSMSLPRTVTCRSSASAYNCGVRSRQVPLVLQLQVPTRSLNPHTGKSGEKREREREREREEKESSLNHEGTLFLGDGAVQDTHSLFQVRQRVCVSSLCVFQVRQRVFQVRQRPLPSCYAAN
jgi:hypothetical protein